MLQLDFVPSAPTAKAAWERVAGAYEQCLHALWPVADYLPSAVPAFLGELLARVSASYYAEEARFVNDVWSVLNKVRKDVGLPDTSRTNIYRDPLFIDSTDTRSLIANRRRSTPLEAAIETIRRLRDVRILESALGEYSVAALLGGSASYGRFLNVRGGGDPSDLDIMVIVDSFGGLENLLAGLSSIKEVSDIDIVTAVDRATEFMQLADNAQDRYVFSGKFRLWMGIDDPLLEGCGVPSEYQLSVHVVTRAGFGRLLFEDASIIASSIVGNDQSILDYREAKPNRRDSQRSFSGRSQAISIDVFSHGKSFVRETKIFMIDQHAYYPGMFQNLVLPAFDVRWGDSDCRRLVDAFRWKMIDRLRYEQRISPNKLLRLSLAHTRSEVFAPHVVRSVDASTLLG